MKPPAPVAKAGHSASQLVHNPKALAGVAGVVVVVALFSRRAAGGSSPSTSSGQITPGQGGYYDSTANDVYNSLMGQIQSLGMAQGASTSGVSTPTPAPNRPPVTKPTPAPPRRTFRPPPKSPPRRPAPKPAPQTSYTVRRGDSLSAIAGRLGVKDWRSIYSANVRVIGPDPNKIKPGQKLNLAGLIGR